MDFLVLAIVLGIVALALGFSIYLIMMKMFQTEKVQVFAFGLLMLIISELMVVFLMVLCIFKLTGIA
ncbi:MAG: hypothetical protein J5673_00770 [Candidatus Methanomethylophilaceae archaeon]|nr:hypothetical protein [Candidatus Methanomethylophilaceae archaeon]